MILGHRFTVKVSPLDTAGHPWKTGDEKEFGETCTNSYTIHLNPDQTPAQLQATCLHEFLHAIFHVSGLSNLLTEGSEEAFAVALEHGLSPLYQLKGSK